MLEDETRKFYIAEQALHIVKMNSSEKKVLPKIQKTLKKYEIKATVFHLNQNESDSKNLKINEGFFVLKI